MTEEGINGLHQEVASLRNALDSMATKLESVERDVVILRERSGRIAMTGPMLLLVWTVLVSVVGMAVFVGRLDYTVRESVENNRRLVTVVEAHVRLPSHDVTGVRMLELDRRLDVLERRAGLSR